MAPSLRPQKQVPLIVFVLAFVAAGIISLFLFDSGSMPLPSGQTVSTGDQSAQKAADSSLPVVKLAPAAIPQEAIHLKAKGVVDAGRSSELSSNVDGMVEWVNPRFQSGGILTEGEPVVRIGKQFYAAALADAKAELELARLAQAEEQTEAMKAVRKWDNNPKAKGDRSELVLRVPHRRAVAARVAAAEERVKQAEMLAGNTTVSAPYDCHVSSRQVDMGTYVGKGDPLGCVFSAREREVRIPLSLEKLNALPRDEKGNICSLGTVSFLMGGEVMRWDVDIARVSSQADPHTQEVMVVASIRENPAYLPEFRVPPLNLQLDVDFQAQTTDGLFWIPIASMAGDSEIWVMTESGLMEKRPVNVEQADGDRRLVVLLAKLPGDRICMGIPTEARAGMKVRAENAEVSPPAAN